MDKEILSSNKVDDLIKNEEVIITDIEKDILGEVGNIAVGSSLTILSNLVKKRVNITTPKVSVSTLSEINKGFTQDNVIFDLEYTKGINGRNVIVMESEEAMVIAEVINDGQKLDIYKSIDTIKNALGEMAKASSSAIESLLLKEVNMSSPKGILVDSDSYNLNLDMEENENIIKIDFTLKFEELIEFGITLILPVNTSKSIISIMMSSLGM